MYEDELMAALHQRRARLATEGMKGNQPLGGARPMREGDPLYSGRPIRLPDLYGGGTYRPQPWTPPQWRGLRGYVPEESPFPQGYEPQRAPALPGQGGMPGMDRRQVMPQGWGDTVRPEGRQEIGAALLQPHRDRARMELLGQLVSFLRGG